MKKRFLVPLVFLCMACDPSDCSGSDNEVDETLDTDGDGLTDVREAELGTDPNKADTDGDGYTDFEENHAETDPLDADSKIYKGGWPYNPNKDDIEATSISDVCDPPAGTIQCEEEPDNNSEDCSNREDDDNDGLIDCDDDDCDNKPKCTCFHPTCYDMAQAEGKYPYQVCNSTKCIDINDGSYCATTPIPCTNDFECNTGYCWLLPIQKQYCAAGEGWIFPRIVSTDQYGDEVDIYDFANHGKLVVIEMSTAWCPPCQQVANWLATGDLAIQERPWWKVEYEALREVFLNGEFYWITFLYENADHGQATAEDPAYWHEAFPSEQMTVLVDPYKDLHCYFKPMGIPLVNIVDENMKTVTTESQGLSVAFDKLLETFVGSASFDGGSLGDAGP